MQKYSIFFCLTLVMITHCCYVSSLTLEETVNLIFKSPEMKTFDEEDESNIQQKASIRALLMDSKLFAQSIDDAKRCNFWDREPHYEPITPRTFPCKVSSVRNIGNTATSVHKLKPSDISVIAAMGDSISAGTGIAAHTALGIINCYRGLVYSVGGDANFTTNPTVANILRLYNPQLKGYAQGITSRYNTNAGFDVSRPGDKSKHMLAQARLLVNRLNKDKTIDQKNDWKMITMFIGGNDLCASCRKPAEHTSEVFVTHIQEALDFLHQNLNRTFVNLVGVLDVSQMYDLNCGVVCSAIHLVECRCAAYGKQRETLRQLEQQYQSQSCNLIASGRYDQRDDFTVVFQPFFVNTSIPRLSNGLPDISYFAPDCFHLSAKGHAAMALSLWNNLFEPLPNKKMVWHEGEAYACPTDSSPYFATAKNSGPAKCPTE